MKKFLIIATMVASLLVVGVESTKVVASDTVIEEVVKPMYDPGTPGM